MVVWLQSSPYRHEGTAMKKLDEIETNAKRAIIEKNEGSIHYVAPAFISPDDALALVAALRSVLGYAADPNSQHTEECSYVTTYNSKSLDCDCYKFEIKDRISRELGEAEEV
jgi:hypothetical protein